MSDGYAYYSLVIPEHSKDGRPRNVDFLMEVKTLEGSVETIALLPLQPKAPESQAL